MATDWNGFGSWSRIAETSDGNYSFGIRLAATPSGRNMVISYALRFSALTSYRYTANVADGFKLVIGGVTAFDTTKVIQFPSGGKTSIYISGSADTYGGSVTLGTDAAGNVSFGVTAYFTKNTSSSYAPASFSGSYSLSAGGATPESYSVVMRIANMDCYGNYGNSWVWINESQYYGATPYYDGYGTSDATYNQVTWSGTITGNVDVTLYASRKAYAFNLNIYDPDGTERYTDGGAGTVEFSSDDGVSYSWVYNEPASSYYIDRPFRIRGISPASGMRLSSITGATDMGDGTYRTTQSSSGTVINIYMERASCTITYDANNGTGAPDSQTKIYGTDISLSDTIPTRDGYVFLGWGTSSDATKDNIAYQPGDTYTADADLNLFAIWVTAYNITYNANGGTDAPAAQIKGEGIDLVLSSSIPTRDNYRFLGWGTAYNTTRNNISYQPGDTYSKDEDLDLYAVWVKLYSITYDANEGSNAPSTQLKEEDVDITITSSEPIRNWYDFLGWSTSIDAEESNINYPSGSVYSKNEDLNLFAVWKIIGSHSGSWNGYGNWSSIAIMNNNSYSLDVKLNAVPNGRLITIYYAFRFSPLTSYTTSRTIPAGFTLSIGEVTVLDSTTTIEIAANSTSPIYISGSSTDYGGSISLSSDISGSLNYAVTASYSKKTSISYAPPSFNGTYNLSATGATPESFQVTISISNMDCYGNYTSSWIWINNTFTYGTELSYSCYEDDETYNPVVWSGTVTGIINVTIPASRKVYNFELNIFKPDYSKSTDETNGKLQLSTDGGNTYNWIAASTSSQYYIGTPFKISNIIPGYKMRLSSVSGATDNGDDTYSATQSSSGTIINVYMEWSTYNITYNANGGTNAPADQIKEEYEDIVLSTDTPTRVGYRFLGWGTTYNATASQIKYYPGDTYTIDDYLNLFAVWLKTYDITYNANGGSNAPEAQLKDEGTDIVLSSVEPTRDNYKFLGWGTSSNATKNNIAYQPGDTYNIEADLNLYAIWLNTYNIIYDANEGVGAPEAQTKDKDVDIVLSSVIPTRTGYKFLGWGTSSDATASQIAYSPSDTYSANADLNLFAIWSRIFFIVYNANEGINAPATQIKDIGIDIVLSDTSPTRTGYTFLGWGLAADAQENEIAYQPGDTYTTEADLNLYAIWNKKKYNVTYNINTGDGDLPESKVVEYGIEYQISNQKPYKAGYIFKCWGNNTDLSTSTIKYNSGEKITIEDHDYLLYALWKELPTILVYSENGRLKKIMYENYVIEEK